MKKIFCIITLVLMLAPMASAESASAILTKAVNALHAGKSVSASYAISSGSSRSSGTIAAEGAMFKIASPQMNVWYDGRTQWTHVVADREVSISEPTAAELQQVNPFAIIDSACSAYNAKTLKSASGTVAVELTPKKAKAVEGISKVVVTLGASNYLPQRLVITMTSRTVVTITVSSVKTGASLGVGAFRPTQAALKGLTVNDLR